MGAIKRLWEIERFETEELFLNNRISQSEFYDRMKKLGFHYDQILSFVDSLNGGKSCASL